MCEDLYGARCCTLLMLVTMGVVATFVFIPGGPIATEYWNNQWDTTIGVVDDMYYSVFLTCEIHSCSCSSLASTFENCETIKSTWEASIDIFACEEMLNNISISSYPPECIYPTNLACNTNDYVYYNYNNCLWSEAVSCSETCTPNYYLYYRVVGTLNYYGNVQVDEEQYFPTWNKFYNKMQEFYVGSVATIYYMDYGAYPEFSLEPVIYEMNNAIIVFLAITASILALEMMYFSCYWINNCIREKGWTERTENTYICIIFSLIWFGLIIPGVLYPIWYIPNIAIPNNIRRRYNIAIIFFICFGWAPISLYTFNLIRKSTKYYAKPLMIMLLLGWIVLIWPIIWGTSIYTSLLVCTIIVWCFILIWLCFAPVMRRMLADIHTASAARSHAIQDRKLQEEQANMEFKKQEEQRDLATLEKLRAIQQSVDDTAVHQVTVHLDDINVHAQAIPVSGEIQEEHLFIT